jgi:hypothetical protein
MLKDFMFGFWCSISVGALILLINSFFNEEIPRYVGGLAFMVLVIGIGTIMAINRDDQ